MPVYIDRNGDEIWLAGSSPYDGFLGIGAFLVLIPVCLVVCPAFLLADVIVGHFYAATGVFLALSAIAALVLARQKYKRPADTFVDALGNFSTLFSYYLITYLYFVPSVRIKSEGIIVWLIFLFFETAFVFIRQCVRKIINSSVLNCLLGVFVLLLIYAAFCSTVHLCNFNENYVLRAYNISDGSFLYKILKTLFYIPSVLLCK